MHTYSVEILNPKAFKLLKDLADLELISIKKEKIKKQNVTDFQQILLNGPTRNEEEYQEYLKNREAINSIGRI
jgi:lantibiotic modifying enzyme